MKNINFGWLFAGIRPLKQELLASCSWFKGSSLK
jgi:hypothetical protein